MMLGCRSLTENGLTSQWGFYFSLSTEQQFLDGFNVAQMSFVYTPGINLTDDIRAVEKSYMGEICIPTVERALVNCILYPESLYEGYFIEGLYDYVYAYLKQKPVNQIERLVGVANKYGISEETVKYWVADATEYYSKRV